MVKKTSLKTLFKDAGLALAGILSAGLGLKSFLLPNQFIDGGVTGISLLVTEITGWPLALLIAVLNLPFILLGYKQVSPEFAFRTLLAIGGLALALVLVPYPILTQDKLLIAVFGGFFLGLGIGLAVRGGCVIDGTEILALYLSRKTSLSVGDIILLINIVIFSVAASLLGIETALYSLLTYLSASKAIDFIIEGIEEYMGVTIISDEHGVIQEAITRELGHGLTIYKGQRGFGFHEVTQAETNILFTVVTRLEVAKLQATIEALDPKAFVLIHSINDTKGGMVKKRPLH